MTLFRNLICALLFLLSGCNAHAEDVASLVRNLNLFQNRMAMGDISARTLAAQQFDTIERVLSKADFTIDTDEKTVRAVIIYLMCGGAAPKERNGLPAKSVSRNVSELLDASLLYSDGKDGGVPKELMKIDPKSVPQTVGGHLALVQAGALIDNDNERAQSLLDLARLLMPGSLIEEAALRRQIAIIDPARDPEKIVLLSFRYLSQYSNSPYARNFWDTMKRITIEDPVPLQRLEKFAPIIDRGPADLKTSLYLEITKQFLITGKFKNAQETIERLASVDDPESARRVTVYRNLLAALKDDSSEASLKRFDSRGLNRGDAALVGMVSSVMSALSERNSKAEASGNEINELSESMRRALANADDLLKRAGNR